MPFFGHPDRTAVIAIALLTHVERATKEIGNDIKWNEIEVTVIFAAALLFLCCELVSAAGGGK